MNTEKRICAGHQIIAACDLPDHNGLTERQIVIGERIGSTDERRFCTWDYSKESQYNFGCYDLTREDAYENMLCRAASAIGGLTVCQKAI